MDSRMKSAEEQRLIDARIAEIKRKEQLIKKRQQEIEEDIRLAAEQDALVNLKPVADDWLPGKLKPNSRVSFGEVEEMNPTSKQMPYRGRGRTKRFDDQRVGGPPPDPISFLADPERDNALSDSNSMHYQPRNNRQELRQEPPPKNLNENWRGEEKRLPAKPIKTQDGDWREEKHKNVDRNWREDGAGDYIRDDRNPGVKTADMVQDWRRPQAPPRAQTGAPNDSYIVDEDNFGHTRYLPNPNENTQNPSDLRNKLMEKRTASRLPPDSREEELQELPYSAFNKHPSPTNSELLNSQRTYDDPQAPQNSAYYPNSKAPSYEPLQKVEDLSKVYRAESDDGWEASEQSLVNQKVYREEPTRTQYWKEDDSLNYYEDRPPTVNATPQYIGTQRIPAEPPRREPQERFFRTQSQINDNEWAPEIQRAQNIYPNEQYSSNAGGPYSNDASFEQPPSHRRIVNPPTYDRQPVINQQTLSSGGSRQNSALNTGRPDDAYAYFQAKMAKARAQQVSSLELDEMQAQFSKMYQTPPDRRTTAGSASAQMVAQYQYAETNTPTQVPVNERQYAEKINARHQIAINSQSLNSHQHSYPEANSLHQQLPNSRNVSHHQYAEMSARQPQSMTQQQYEANCARQVPARSMSMSHPEYNEMIVRQQALQPRNNNQVDYAEMVNTRHHASEPQNLSQRQYSEPITARQPVQQPQRYLSHQIPESRNIDHEYGEIIDSHQRAPLSHNTIQQEYGERIISRQQPVPNIHPQSVSQPQYVKNHYAEMNAPQQVTSMENMSSVNQPITADMNDRIRRCREQAILAPHASNAQQSYAEPRSQIDYQRLEAMKQSGFVEYNSSVGRNPMKGTDNNRHNEELMQNYSSRIEVRPNLNIPRSHPSMEPDLYSDTEYDTRSVDPSQNHYLQESRSVSKQTASEPQEDQWTAQMVEMRQLAGQAVQQSSQPNWNVQPPQQQQVNGRQPQPDSESLLAFQNELVAHATDRIQARVNSALNDRLKRARDAALQEKLEPPLQPSPVGRAIKGCSQPSAGDNQPQILQPQIDSWQNSIKQTSDYLPAIPLQEPQPSKSPDVNQHGPESVQSCLLREPEAEVPLEEEQIEINLPTCIDLSKPPPAIPGVLSSGPPDLLSDEITAKIFSAPPPVIPELNPDSDDAEKLIAKPYYQYKPPSNQSFRPKLTFSLEKKGLEKTDQSSATSSASSPPKNDRLKKDTVSKDEKASNKKNQEVVAEKRISAAERVAKLLETPVVLPDYTPSYVLKVLGEEEIKNIKSRTAGNSRNAQNVGS
ncbi:unnamed protein product [Bemisia tabaci]|uniref:Uncharacterized protein n=1 Tax=Bemisia tabaci TaxID=7038 RepID=A0A9P0CB50_BEMTA|nr:unnamed protein product [Bemisia tabaci]